MKLDKQRVNSYLYDIQRGTDELVEILQERTDKALLIDTIVMKAIKYTLIEIAEAMANTLQHILAKGFGKPVSGYIDTVVKAKEHRIITDRLSSSIMPFFKFRNALIHRYWIMDDKTILRNLRSKYKDFFKFVGEIKRYAQIK